jgi:hypothetical protein
VVTAVLLGAAIVLIAGAGLAWTWRLVRIGNLDAMALAEKVAMPEPVSALDWPELLLREVICTPGDPSEVLLLVQWPAYQDRLSTLVITVDDRARLELLTRWRDTRASIAPVRCGADLLELRRRRSLQRVLGVLIVEDFSGRGTLDSGCS